jgi:hypothetical protein
LATATPGEFSNCGVGTLGPYMHVHVKEKPACRLWWNGEYVYARGDYYFRKKDSKGQTPGGESVLISYSDSLPAETIRDTYAPRQNDFWVEIIHFNIIIILAGKSILIISYSDSLQVETIHFNIIIPPDLHLRQTDRPYLPKMKTTFGSKQFVLILSSSWRGNPFK